MLAQLPDKKTVKKKLRRYLKAQSTIHHWMGLKINQEFGFYIPYTFKKFLRVPTENDHIQWITDHFNQRESIFLENIKAASQYKERFQDFKQANSENVNQPRLNSNWFPGMDGAMAYTLIRTHKPKKIIEVGSGHSTRFLRQAVTDGGFDCHIHSIDPEPRREIDLICDQITRGTVTEVSPSIFKDLGESDVLFIDCSHIAMPGSDVDFLFTEVLPLLNKGVLIHIHDIFLPFGYPESWHWRGYNEQMLLASLMGVKGAFDVLWPSYFMRKNYRRELEDLGVNKNPE
ncbi:MAG: class I SAM-dependent methyltransferase, partial [Pseudomonadota bacterium]